MPVIKDSTPDPSPGPRKSKDKGRSKGKGSSSHLGSSRSKPKSRQSTPPNRVDPGWVHEILGIIGLKVIEAVAARNGLTLDLVDEEIDDLIPVASGGEDGPDPKEVAARIVAHLGHRIPGVKRIEKRLEGRDKTSGIWSDGAALGAMIYARNSEAIETLIKNTLTGKNRPGRNSRPINGDVPHTDTIDFGIVGSPTQNGDGNA